MGIFTRFMDIVNSNINSLLDKAEDPGKMLKLMIQEMEDTIIELKSACASRMAEEIRTEKLAKDTESAIERWHNRAVLAIEKGKEDLAREALTEKRTAIEKAERIKEHLLSLSQSIEASKEEIKTLEDKISQSKLKLKTLQDKAQRARENAKTSPDLSSQFDDMEDRINRNDAWNNLNRKEETAEEKFLKMERDSEIESELEKLKQERGL